MGVRFRRIPKNGAARRFNLDRESRGVTAAHVYWFISQDSRLCENGVDLDTCYSGEEEERSLESTRHAERHREGGEFACHLPPAPFRDISAPLPLPIPYAGSGVHSTNHDAIEWPIRSQCCVETASMTI